MNSRISDLALDLGVFALDNEIENGEMYGPDSDVPLYRARARLIWQNAGSGNLADVQFPAFDSHHQLIA